MPSVAPEISGSITNHESQEVWDKYAMDILYEGGSSYYSFDVGLVHMVCLNTYNTRYGN